MCVWWRRMKDKNSIQLRKETQNELKWNVKHRQKHERNSV